MELKEAKTRSAVLVLYDDHGIHSMELKEDPGLGRLLGLGSPNPFNGIERYVYEGRLPPLDQPRIHSMELKDECIRSNPWYCEWS